MKVFIYKKRNNEKVGSFNNVSEVKCSDQKIHIYCEDGSEAVYDCKEVKTTTYQN